MTCFLQDYRFSALPLLLTAFMLLCGRAAAQTPETISYQGFLTSPNGNPVEGQYDLTFRLYDQPDGGTAIWAETQTEVTVSSGIFALRLGGLEPLSPVPFDQPLYLAVSVEGGVEMEPRVVLTASPHSLSTRGPSCTARAA